MQSQIWLKTEAFQQQIRHRHRQSLLAQHRRALHHPLTTLTPASITHDSISSLCQRLSTGECLLQGLPEDMIRCIVKLAVSGQVGGDELLVYLCRSLADKGKLQGEYGHVLGKVFEEVQVELVVFSRIGQELAKQQPTKTLRIRIQCLKSLAFSNYAPVCSLLTHPQFLSVSRSCLAHPSFLLFLCQVSQSAPLPPQLLYSLCSLARQPPRCPLATMALCSTFLNCMLAPHNAVEVSSSFELIGDALLNVAQGLIRAGRGGGELGMCLEALVGVLGAGRGEDAIGGVGRMKLVEFVAYTCERVEQEARLQLLQMLVMLNNHPHKHSQQPTQTHALLDQTLCQLLHSTLDPTLPPQVLTKSLGLLLALLQSASQQLLVLLQVEVHITDMLEQVMLGADTSVAGMAEEARRYFEDPDDGYDSE